MSYKWTLDGVHDVQMVYMMQNSTFVCWWMIQNSTFVCQWIPVSVNVCEELSEAEMKVMQLLSRSILYDQSVESPEMLNRFVENKCMCL